MGKNAGRIIVIIIVIALAVAGFMYFKDRALKIAAEEAALKEREAWKHKNELLEKKISGMEKDIDKMGKDLQLADQAPPISLERRQQVFGDNGTGQDASLNSVHNRVMNFFKYIDQKGYLSARGISGTSYEHFKSIMDRLVLASPVISGESQDMLTLLKNITYLFGVLGKTDTLLVRDILNGEAEIMEPTMKLFYQWLDPSLVMQGTGRFTIPFEKQYEYAAYLMQTIGGKAYLFRRDSKTRLLTCYYSILIIDRANQETLNKYGIDIRPLVSSLITDMQSTKLLTGRQEYVAALNIIRKKSEGIKIDRLKMDDLQAPAQP
jgi:hypothetical protein